MQEKKSKLKAFAAALTGAAEEKAAAMNAETERLEREALEEYAAALASAAEKRRASALADAKVKENKRIVAEGLAAKRSLLQFREDCADDVFAEVRRKILELPQRPEYAETLKNQLWRALDAVPGAREPRSGSGARTWLRPGPQLGLARREARIPGGRASRSAGSCSECPGALQAHRPLL